MGVGADIRWNRFSRDFHFKGKKNPKVNIQNMERYRKADRMYRNDSEKWSYPYYFWSHLVQEGTQGEDAKVHLLPAAYTFTY